MGRRPEKPIANLEDIDKKRRSRPALTPKEREQEITMLAYDLAEEQIRKGTVSSQVLAYFIKQGSIEAEYELEKLKKENALLEAKKSAIESAQKSEELFAKAIKAMKKYRGESEDGSEDVL